MATVLTWHSACARVGVGLRVHRRSPLVERLLLAGGLSALAIGWPNRAREPAKGSSLMSEVPNANRPDIDSR